MRLALVAPLLLSGGVSAAGRLPTRVLAPERVAMQNLVVRPKLPDAGGKRDALKLVYIMTNNNLGYLGKKTLEALTGQKRLPPTAHSLVFFDAASEDTTLWSLGDEPATTAASSPLAPGLTGNVPSNDVSVMTKVFRWAIQSHPADRRYLEIYSHGGGMRGVGAGEMSPYVTSYGERATQPIQGLARVLRDGGGGKPFDMVFFTACLMANIEALYEIAPSVRYAVASEVPITGYGNGGTVVVDSPLLYEKLVREGKAPADIARELAKAVTRKDAGGVSTVVAMDLAKLSPLVKQIGKLVTALQALGPADMKLVSAALSSARIGARSWAVGDLWLFARAIDKTVKNPAVQKEVKALYRLQAGATLFERSKEKNGTGGLSIYLPLGGKVELAYAKTRFARETGWDRLLKAAGAR
jgi:hypothetical protein